MVPPSSVVQSGGSTKSSDSLLDGPTPWVRFPCEHILAMCLRLFPSFTFGIAHYYCNYRWCTQAFPNISGQLMKFGIRLLEPWAGCCTST